MLLTRPTTRDTHLTSSFSRTLSLSCYQRGKQSGFSLNEARDYGVSGWQWHLLDHMQRICTSFQTDNHINTSSFNFYTPDALPGTQPTVSKQWRWFINYSSCYVIYVEHHITPGLSLVRQFWIFLKFSLVFCIWRTILVVYTICSSKKATVMSPCRGLACKPCNSGWSLALYDEWAN